MAVLRKCPGCGALCSPTCADNSPKCYIAKHGTSSTTIGCSICNNEYPSGSWKTIDVTIKKRRKIPTNIQTGATLC